MYISADTVRSLDAFSVFDVWVTQAIAPKSTQSDTLCINVGLVNARLQALALTQAQAPTTYHTHSGNNRNIMCR